MSKESAQLDKRQIRKDIFALIIPVILESIFTYLAEIVSAGFVGRLTGLAVTSQGIVIRVISLLNVVWSGIRIGSMVYYVRLYGERRYKELKQGYQNIITITLGIAFVFILVLALFPTQVLSFFVKDTEILDAARSYMYIMLLGIPFNVIHRLNGACYNAMGDTRTPLFMQILNNVINIICGYTFIFALGMDLIGAGIATISAQIICGCLGTFLLYRKPAFREAGLTSFKLKDRESIKQTFLKAIPVAVEDGAWQLSAIVMSKIILTYGSNAYAGFSLGGSAELFTELPVIGFTVAATALAGKAKGQKNGPLFREYFRQQMWMNAIVSGIGGFVMVVFPTLLMRAVTDIPELIEIGKYYLIVMGFIYIPQNVQRTMKGTIYGSMGDTKAPMIIAMIGIWLFRIPLAALAAYVFHAPLFFIWIVIGVDQVARFIMMHFYMKKKGVMQCVALQEENEAKQTA